MLKNHQGFVGGNRSQTKQCTTGERDKKASIHRSEMEAWCLFFVLYRKYSKKSELQYDLC